MKKLVFASAAVAGSMIIFSGGCIKNDLPYPKIPQFITSIAAVGEKSPAVIDNEKYTVAIELEETADIMAVTFSDFSVTEGAKADPDLLEGSYDLSSPLTVNVSLYQDYPWIITASQEIERYLTIAGQIGETVIDAVAHRVVVRVPENLNLSDLELASIKLGPEGITTMSPDLKPGPVDFSQPVAVDVTFHGRTQKWEIFVEKTALVVSTTNVDAWSQVIWAYGNGPADVKNSFRYRRADATEWIEVPVENVTQTEGAFHACLSHLEPLTDYVVCAISGENLGNEVEVTTGSTPVLPDGSFDEWWLDKKIWCPWAEGGTSFWDTGNTGAATLGESNVQPSDDVPPGMSGKSAKLETRFVGLFGIGKLAAGSIYTGTFKKIDGTNGILDFGREWTQRPTRLRGYMKYISKEIDYASTEFADMKGQPDMCHIYFAMTDWTAPYEIRTNPKNRQLFNPDSPEIIAYGELTRHTDTDGWEEFEIVLNYRDTSRVPRYLQITCAASKYGDFFTGGNGSCLWVDDFELLYDY